MNRAGQILKRMWIPPCRTGRSKGTRTRVLHRFHGSCQFPPVSAHFIPIHAPYSCKVYPTAVASFDIWDSRLHTTKNRYYAPPLIGGGIKRWCCLTSVCLTSDVCLSVAYIGPKSRTEKPRKIKIGTEVAHVTSKVKRSKVNLFGRIKRHSLRPYLTYLKVKSTKCICLLPVVLVLDCVPT